jgi:hypothetical protein
MKPLVRKTIREYQREADAEGNTLLLRIEKKQSFEVPISGTTAKATPAEYSCIAEISSPAKDDYGKPLKRRMKIQADNSIIDGLKEGMRSMEAINFSFSPSDGVTQVRHNATDTLVLMYEIPPHKRPNEIQTRYVIGDGEDIRFILGTFESVRDFIYEMENAIKGA